MNVLDMAQTARKVFLYICYNAAADALKNTDPSLTESSARHEKLSARFSRWGNRVLQSGLFSQAAMDKVRLEVAIVRVKAEKTSREGNAAAGLAGFSPRQR